MNKLIPIGIALALATGAVAAHAQTPDQPTPDAGGPAMGAPSDDGPGPADDDGPGRDARPGPMRDGRGPDKARMWRMHGKEMMGHHMMPMMTKGAMFVFDGGRRAGRIVIKCANEDSTQTCADAVKPMLEMMMQVQAQKGAAEAE